MVTFLKLRQALQEATQSSLDLKTDTQRDTLLRLEAKINTAKQAREAAQQEADAAEAVFKKADAKLTACITRIHTLETERYYLRKEINPTAKLPLPIRK